MNWYTNALLLIFGLHGVIASEGNYTIIDETDIISPDYHQNRDAQIRSNKDELGKEERRKSRFYQYYRIKKLRGKSNYNDGSQTVYAYQRKEPQLEHSDSEVYEKNIAFARHYLGNESDADNFQEKGDTRTEYRNDENKDVILRYKEQQNTKHHVDNNDQNDFKNARNYKYYKFNSIKGKLSNTDGNRQINDFQARDHERISNEDNNIPKIYIHKNKNVQYMKKIQSMDRKINQKYETEYGRDGQHNYNVMNLKQENYDDYRHDQERNVKNDRNFINLGHDNNKNYKHDHEKENVNTINHHDDVQSIDLNDNHNHLHFGNRSINNNPDGHENKTHSYVEKETSDIKFYKNQKSDNFNGNSKDHNNYKINKKIDNPGAKIYRYYGIATNTLYHRDRNNRNNSKHRDKGSSFHRYPENNLSFDDIEKHTSDTGEYSKGQIYSETHEQGNNIILPSVIHAPNREEKREHLYNNKGERNFRIVSNPRKHYKRRFQQKVRNRIEKGEVNRVLRTSANHRNNISSSGNVEDRRNKYNCDYGNKTKGNERKQTQKSNSNKNLVGLRRKAEYYRPGPKYFSEYENNNVSIPVEYQGGDKRASSPNYPLEYKANPTNSYAEIQSEN